MFQSLVDLFSGWYESYVSAIRDLISYEVTQIVAVPGEDYSILTDTVSYEVVPDVWSAFVPWEHIIAATVMIVFLVCIFKFMRSVLCKVL